MLEAAQAAVPEPQSEDLVLTRIIRASRRAVFDAFTRPDRLQRWWGPDGFTLTTCELDLRRGGAMRFVVGGPDGAEYPFTGHVLEAIPPARLIFTAELGDDPGDLLLTVVSIDDHDDGTRVTVQQTVPRGAANASGQRRGWSESLEKLALLLAAH
jgi:uncharacterized protein YndB with AHSA1/START domain